MSNIETVVARKSTGCAQQLFDGGTFIWGGPDAGPIHMLQSASLSGSTGQLYDLGYNDTDSSCKLRQGHQVLGRRLAIKVIIDPYDAAAAVARRMIYQIRVVEYTPTVCATAQLHTDYRLPDLPDTQDWEEGLQDIFRVHLKNRFKTHKNQTGATPSLAPKTAFGDAFEGVLNATLGTTDAINMYEELGFEVPVNSDQIRGIGFGFFIQAVIRGVMTAGASADLPAIQAWMNSNPVMVDMMTRLFHSNFLTRLTVKAIQQFMGFTWAGPGTEGAGWANYLFYYLGFIGAASYTGTHFPYHLPDYFQPVARWIGAPPLPQEHPNWTEAVVTMYGVLEMIFTSDEFADFIASGFNGGGAEHITPGSYGDTTGAWLQSVTGAADFNSLPSTFLIPGLNGGSYPSGTETEMKMRAAFNGVLHHFLGPDYAGLEAEADLARFVRINANAFPTADLDPDSFAAAIAGNPEFTNAATGEILNFGQNAEAPTRPSLGQSIFDFGLAAYASYLAYHPGGQIRRNLNDARTAAAGNSLPHHLTQPVRNHMRTATD